MSDTTAFSPDPFAGLAAAADFRFFSRAACRTEADRKQSPQLPAAGASNLSIRVPSLAGGLYRRCWYCKRFLNIAWRDPLFNKVLPVRTTTEGSWPNTFPTRMEAR